MPAKHLFEYAVLRVVPRVEREEFLNVGVILYCSSQGFLQATCELNEARLLAFAGAHLDLADVHERLRSFERICQGRTMGGPIGQLAIASRFRWLLPNAALSSKHRLCTLACAKMPLLP
jgi:hypothetical protein